MSNDLLNRLRGERMAELVSRLIVAAIRYGALVAAIRIATGSWAWAFAVAIALNILEPWEPRR